ncbi:Cationic peroxidase 1, partial [Linum perenne]
SPTFYKQTCSNTFPAIRWIVIGKRQAIQKGDSNGVFVLRLHFHDCFVNVCDGSILLDDTANFTGEKTARPNLNSRVCKGSVVSCSDVFYDSKVTVTR